MDKYITIRPWETNAPNYLVLNTDDLVEIKELHPDKPAWKNWIWCQNESNSGWVPEHFIEIIDDNTGKVLENYSAKELSIGAGEIIVGYNELRGGGNDRTGSHNIVVGRYHNYSSHGGLVVGQGNAITGQFATVSGGNGNRAAGDYSSVSGGYAAYVTGSNDWAAGSLFQED